LTWTGWRSACRFCWTAWRTCRWCWNNTCCWCCAGWRTTVSLGCCCTDWRTTCWVGRCADWETTDCWRPCKTTGFCPSTATACRGCRRARPGWRLQSKQVERRCSLQKAFRHRRQEVDTWKILSH
jgi:hypothetical protein